MKFKQRQTLVESAVLSRAYIESQPYDNDDGIKGGERRCSGSRAHKKSSLRHEMKEWWLARKLYERSLCALLS